MPRGKPNPSIYESHYPSFRQVEWNPDEMDIGATVQGEILQALVRNTFFDRANGLWRLASGDSFGRALVSNALPTGTFIARTDQSVTTIEAQAVGANPQRALIWIEHSFGDPVFLTFASAGVGTFSIELPNDYAFAMDGYQGGVRVSRLGAASTQIKLLEFG